MAASTDSKAKGKKSSWRSLDLGETLDIAGANKMHARLQKALAESRPVRLHAANLGRIDTAALQLLTAFVREAQAADLAVAWQRPSAGLIEAAGLLGLHGILGLTDSGSEQAA